MAFLAFMNRAAARRKSPAPSKTRHLGGVAYLPRPEQCDDGFRPDAVALHQDLYDRVGKHFAKGQFMIDQARARGLAHREGFEIGHCQALSRAGAIAGHR